MTRRCTKCGEWLPLASFRKERHGKNGLRAHCKECDAEYSRKWYVANKERVAESHRKWRKANPEKCRASALKCYYANPEKFNAYSKAWREANPERARQNSQVWRKANLEKLAKKASCRRAREASVICDGTDPTDIFKRDKWVCRICGCHTPPELRGLNVTSSPVLDHIIPLKLGGPHVRRNLQCLCYDCNSHKSAKYKGQLAFA